MRFALTRRVFTSHPIRLVAVTIAATFIPVLAMPPGAATAGGYHGPKPTIVLVHGAWADSSSWSGEIARLQHDGYPVDAAPNPLRGLSFDAAYLKDFLSTVSGPIILVGHSYGGAVMSSAATGNTNVKALVYVDGYAPNTGETVGELSGADSIFAPAATDPTSVFRLVPYPGAPAGAVDTYVLRNLFITKFANGVPRKQAAVLAASQSPASTETFGPFPGTPAWKTIPSYYVLGLLDNAITPDAQEFMATRAHAQITRIKAGHLGLITQPGAVTNVIERAAQQRG
jgi:pimeloyl-ACP methyl ester carboxylesterase